MSRGHWATLEWDYPKRLSDDGRELSHIPNDIYHSILSYFQPCDDFSPSKCKAILFRISLVCRLLRAITIPLLFRDLKISGIGHNSLNRAEYAKFCRYVNEHKPSAISLARFIRECTFSDWPAPNSGPELLALDAYHQALDLYLPAFSRFENLQCLTFYSTSLLPRIIENLTKLRRLRRLAFRNCVFCEVSIEDIESLQILPLTSLTLCGCDNASNIHLGVTTARLEELRTDDWDFVTRLIDVNGQLSSLRTLELDLHANNSLSISALTRCLNSLPTLSELFIDNLKIYTLDTLPDPIQLPALRVLRSPSQMINIFSAQGLRKVIVYQAISRTASPTIPSTCPRIQLGTASFSENVANRLIQLEIPLTWIIGFSLDKHFPCLEILGLCHSGPLIGNVFPNTDPEVSIKDILEASEAWSHLKSLRELKLHVNHPFKDELPWNLEAQHYLITMFVVTNTSLDRVSFTPHVWWRRVPFGELREWKPVVPFSKREDVRDMLRILSDKNEEYPGMFVDYDDCFAALLA
ncbi:hypothetical protein K435DRAFT_964220 [Dendrothele bispora CBS 962.96]|uniref:F-box domain-containing protein n=1 Tax=Dendrothele bispora (strain CBS 962.96) TaxID=1314807 RepID=A0A4S8MD74_DENBC|nr:hypothetical protein K435DRAFT_964220 [Dendrothele bispora CBS 962.96]